MAVLRVVMNFDLWFSAHAGRDLTVNLLPPFLPRRQHMLPVAC